MSASNCKICGSSKTVFNFPSDSRVLKCSDCGIVFLAPEMTMANPGDYYSERFRADKYTDEDTKKFLCEDSRELLKIIEKIRTQGNLLDIGASIGMFVDEANKHGYEAMGIEPSKNLVAKARELSIPVTESTIEEFNTNRNFNLITMFHVFEHLAEPLKALDKIRSIQSDRGLLIIEVPNIESYLAKKDGIFWKFIALEHLFYFSDKTLSRVLENAGYKIVLTKKRNFELNRLNIRKLIGYFIGKKLAKDRFFVKKESQTDAFVKDSISKLLIRKLLLFLISLLGREDHVLIIAQKL